MDEHHIGTYTSLLLAGKLWKHLAEIDAACNERMDVRVSATVKREGVTEALKAHDQMARVTTSMTGQEKLSSTNSCIPDRQQYPTTAE